MKNTTILTPLPSKREKIWGFIYLFLELLVLPVLLSLLNPLLPRPLSIGQLNCLLFVINFVVVVLIFRRFLLATLRSFRPRVFAGFGLGLLAYLGGNSLVGRIILAVDPEFLNVNDSAIALMAEENFWLICSCAVLLVPITEELLFRGLLFGGLRRRSPVLAYAVSTAAFALIHVVSYIGQYPPTTLLLCLLQYIPASLALAWAWDYSGSILAPVMVHMLINAIGMLAMRMT